MLKLTSHLFSVTTCKQQCIKTKIESICTALFHSRIETLRTVSIALYIVILYVLIIVDKDNIYY